MRYRPDRGQQHQYGFRYGTCVVLDILERQRGGSRKYLFADLDRRIGRLRSETWSLYGSVDNSAWILLDRRVDQRFDERKQTRSFDFTNTRAYRYLKLEVEENNGGAETASRSSAFVKSYSASTT